MLYFVLFMQNNQPVFAGMWSDVSYSDDLEPLVVEVRKRCAEQNGQYVALWGFSLKHPLDEVCCELHDEHGEVFRYLAAEAFGKGYRKGMYKTKLPIEDWKFSPKQVKFCRKHPKAKEVLNAARSLGLLSGVRDYPE